MSGRSVPKRTDEYLTVYGNGQIDVKITRRRR